MYQYDIDPSWVDSIEPDDYDSAARLYLEAKRDAYSTATRRSTAQKAQATIRALDVRFPGVDRHAATATAEELAITGDRSMRRTHEAERATSGLSRADRRSEKEPQPDPMVDAAMAYIRVIKLVFYVAFWPWTWMIKRALQKPKPKTAAVPTNTDTEEEIPF